MKITMKLRLLLGLMLLLSTSLQAQKIFDKYENNENVSFISISPKMFQFIAQLDINTDDEETQAYLEMVKSINNFKVLISTDKEIANDFKADVQSMVKKNTMETLMRVRDEDTNVVFYMIPGKNDNEIKRLVMHVQGMPNGKLQIDKKRQVESVLLLLDGNLNLDQIARLSDKMDLPAGEQLKKVKKKQ